LYMVVWKERLIGEAICYRGLVEVE
jgi:hypothetical protein